MSMIVGKLLLITVIRLAMVIL